jgi:hypothetical protein
VKDEGGREGKISSGAVLFQYVFMQVKTLPLRALYRSHWLLLLLSIVLALSGRVLVAHASWGQILQM